MNTDDRKLVLMLEKLQKGEKNVFCEIEEMFFPLIHSLVMKYSQGEYEQESIQEARLALYNSALSYDVTQKDVSFGLYAKICISNALVSDARKRKHKRQPIFSLDEIEEFGTYSTYFPEESYDLSKHLIDNEDAEFLYNKAISVLSKYECRVFDLYVKGYTTTQIATELGKTEKSISNALCRMTTKLRILLK